MARAWGWGVAVGRRVGIFQIEVGVGTTGSVSRPWGRTGWPRRGSGVAGVGRSGCVGWTGRGGRITGVSRPRSVGRSRGGQKINRIALSDDNLVPPGNPVVQFFNYRVGVRYARIGGSDKVVSLPHLLLLGRVCLLPPGLDFGNDNGLPPNHQSDGYHHQQNRPRKQHAKAHCGNSCIG